MKKKIAIIGGGSSAHTLIPLLSKAGYEINLLTSRPESWKKKIQLEHQSETGEVKEIFEGDLSIVSDDPAKVLANINFIILCMPVSQYKPALNRIAPFIDSKQKVYLGTIYGQGGFNWMIDEIKAKHSLNNLVAFAFDLIPWICRIKKYGEVGILYGSKAKNIVAVDPLDEFENLKKTFLQDVCGNENVEIYLADNFISITLSVTNQIIHPSRIYGLYLKNHGIWDKKEDVPLFYKDFDDISADILKKVDNDYSKIREKLKKDNPDVEFRYMLDYISLDKFYFDSSSDDIKTAFTNSKTLRLIETPVVMNKDHKWELDKNHRFFTDDIFYGLCIAKWFAEHFSLKTPMIDEILEWAQKILGISLIKDGKLLKDCTLNGVEIGTPEKYKLSLKESLI